MPETMPISAAENQYRFADDRMQQVKSWPMRNAGRAVAFPMNVRPPAEIVCRHKDNVGAALIGRLGPPAPPPFGGQGNRTWRGEAAPSPRLRGEGRGEGALRKLKFATQSLWKGPLTGICAKGAQIPTFPRKRGEVECGPAGFPNRLHRPRNLKYRHND